MNELSCGEESLTIYSAVFIQCQRVTDEQTDGQTDGQTNGQPIIYITCFSIADARKKCSFIHKMCQMSHPYRRLRPLSPLLDLATLYLGFHYPSWRPELTARVDGWPVSINTGRVDGWWKPVTRQLGPSTRVVETALIHGTLHTQHDDMTRSVIQKMQYFCERDETVLFAVMQNVVRS